ncbi:MAG: acyl-CoA dehydrogenase [Rhodothalassiaceae bacterium]
MRDYQAPVDDMAFTLETVCDWASLNSLERFREATPDLVGAVLEEAGRFAREVLAPLNPVGDRTGSRLEGDGVRTPEGFADAYRRFVEGGWNGLAAPVEWGGQGLPFVLALAVQEMWTSANMSFALCPMLTQGAIEALEVHGSEELKRVYLDKLVSGEWTGTMNLTEPQAGSDVGALKTRAEPLGDGRFAIRGQKIFITWGEHDMAENIVHLVLARTPGAPEGTRGISLFLVPKFLPDAAGRPGARNDLRCVSLEHKLGIHASPTCVMQYGETEGAIGWLVGEEMKGMRAMFTMMNAARINVGLQGVAIAERAGQEAIAFAHERIQSKDIADPAAGPVPIIRHPDVRRMLMSMKATTEAIRAIAYHTAAAVDRAQAAEDEAAQRAAQGRADLLTPVTKAFATDMGVEVASLAIQVHGGMGYVEETGVAQYFRDARIAPIYEGTNGIQAMDLAFRKLDMDGGAHWKAFIAEMQDFAAGLPREGVLGAIRTPLLDGIEALRSAAQWMVGNEPAQVRDRAAAASPFLRLFGTVAGGYLLAREAVTATRRLEAGEGKPAFLRNKIASTHFFAEQMLPPAVALLGPITRGAATLDAVPEGEFV